MKTQVEAGREERAIAAQLRQAEAGLALAQSINRLCDRLDEEAKAGGALQGLGMLPNRLTLLRDAIERNTKLR